MLKPNWINFLGRAYGQVNDIDVLRHDKPFVVGNAGIGSNDGYWAKYGATGSLEGRGEVKLGSSSGSL